jgi:trans-aconitate methyltransferase
VVVGHQSHFRPDLYRGTAVYYDRYRVPYPALMLDDLANRAELSGTGRLLDLACGTGQVTFGLCSRFSAVVAVDQEDETVAFARSKAGRLGAINVTWLTAAAEQVQEDEPFELVTVGNAFHRLERRRVAALIFDWLVPGGHVALLWSSTPWTGAMDWQRAMGDVARRWSHAAGATDRIPAGLDAAIAAEPNLAVLAAAGLDVVGTFDFPTLQTWTLDTLIGLMYSTSFLSRGALGDHADRFEHDLRDRLLAVNSDGVFHDEMTFTYQLAVRHHGNEGLG